jgi:hypothetical protein
MSSLRSLAPHLRFFVFALIAALGVSAFAAVSMAGGHTGFPLDDAWIHQTYARNWAQTGQLAFVPGQPSAGSTAPLWTLLISAAHRFGFDYFSWTLTLGVVSLALTGWLIHRLTGRLLPHRPGVAWLAGLLSVLEWHLIWAAASGMETLLFIALALAVIDGVWAGGRGWWIGTLGGLLILTRPEGVLLLALAAAVVAARPDHGGLKELMALAGAALLALAPGAWFNLQAGGALFPNTFYAKQAEYAVLMSSPGVWLSAVGQMLAAPLAGAGAALLPGLAVWIAAQRRALWSRAALAKWLPLVWAAAHLGAYALRLPVHYQHGRYLLPLIPVIILYGVAGLAVLAGAGRGRAAQLSGRVLGLAALALAIVFLPLGAAAYAADTAIIDDEMVATARWLHLHTPPDALVAAHDIGALGYFAGRPLLDMAGLISPEVVPFIRDEDQLWAWVQARGAQYVVAFPDWYPRLTARPELTAVFEGRAAASPTHLTVYAVK